MAAGKNTEFAATARIHEQRKFKYTTKVGTQKGINELTNLLIS
jgi:hypothetical protein